MSKCLCGCGRDLLESTGKPRKFWSEGCRMKYNRRGGSEQVVPEETNKPGEKANKIENEQEKANIREFTPGERKKLLEQKKRAVWSDVLANPSQRYSEAVIESCGGSPNALYAERAKVFVAKEKKAGRWDHGKRYQFREEIF